MIDFLDIVKSGNNVDFRALGGGKVLLDGKQPVYTTNAQTITGSKTFASEVNVNTGSNWGQYQLNSASGYYRALEADNFRLRLDVRDTTNTTDRRFIDFYSGSCKTDNDEAIEIFRDSTIDGKTTTTSTYVATQNWVKSFFKNTPTQLYYGALTKGDTVYFSDKLSNYSIVTILYQLNDKSENETIITIPTGIIKYKTSLKYFFAAGTEHYAKGTFTDDSFVLNTVAGDVATLGLEIYAW